MNIELNTLQRESIVLNVAGEIFGAMKRGGLREMETEMIASDDPAAIVEWVNDVNLHRFLFNAAHPELVPVDALSDDDTASLDAYDKEFDAFDVKLRNVINPQEGEDD